MKFLQIFFSAAIVFCLPYYAVVLVLIDAPISAEYWVAEMITIKREIVRKYSGKDKIIIAGGSSTLFGFDTEELSRQLKIPVINFGLHAQLKLDKILYEVNELAEKGDVIVLALEPSYYVCHDRLTPWQVGNVIAWDHNAWERMSFQNKIELVSLVTPSMLGEMVAAEIQKNFYSNKIAARLEAQENSSVLLKFQNRVNPATFKYSAFHLNSHGDMLSAAGSKYKGAGWDQNQPNHVCKEVADQLATFIERMKGNGSRVYFANTPYIASAEGSDLARNAELEFLKEFKAIGCFIDNRVDLIFDRKYFFNSNMHLNVDGKAARTTLFIDAFRKRMGSGGC